jgi:hypothetical protein
MLGGCLHGDPHLMDAARRRPAAAAELGVGKPPGAGSSVIGSRMRTVCKAAVIVMLLVGATAFAVTPPLSMSMSAGDSSTVDQTDDALSTEHIATAGN